MTTASPNLDIEDRLEKAALELLRADTALATLFGSKVRAARQLNVSADYPLLTASAANMTEDFERAGWYRGGLTLTAHTYSSDDPTQDTLKSGLGTARGWAQQADLVAQLNATASASASGSELQVVYALLDGGAFDESDEHVQRRSIVLQVVARPSRATTT